MNLEKIDQEVEIVIIEPEIMIPLVGALNEFKTVKQTIVETAADRTVFSRTENDKYFFRKETNGYPEMTFVVPVIAATYGVSEREFLKHAIMGRDNLINFLASTAKETSNEVAGFLDGIELNLAKMHKALYSKRKNPIPEDKY